MRASATTRSNPPPATTCSSQSTPSRAAAGRSRTRRADDMNDIHDKLDAWIDAHFDEEVRFLQGLVQVPTDTPPGNGAPHAQRTAECFAGFGYEARETPGAEAEVRAGGLPVDHQPDRAPPLRRRPDDRAERARRRRAAGRRLEARPLRRRGRGRQALRPRRRGEQVRLRHLHVRPARARLAGAARRAGAVELHFTYDEEFGGELGPGWLLASRLDAARPADRRRLQLPGGERRTTAACRCR